MSITRINRFYAAENKSEELFDFLTSLTQYILSSKGNISCEVLRDTKNNEKFVVIEKWEDIESHKNSVEAFPKDKRAEVVALLGMAPKGGYYQ